jgi:hypothetical protein
VTCTLRFATLPVPVAVLASTEIVYQPGVEKTTAAFEVASHLVSKLPLPSTSNW